MTAVNVIQQPHRVIILTDGASYDRRGVLHEIGQKCSDVPGREMVVATSGSVKLRRDMLILLPRHFENIDDVAKGGDAFFRSYMDAWRDDFARAGRTGGLFVVAGWSTVVDAPIYVLYSEDRHDASKTEFRISPYSMTMPNSAGRPAIDRSTFDPRTDGLALMEHQRRDRTDGGFLVGGHVQLTEITRAGISHEIIRVWNEDVVGERIRPAPALDPVAHANVTPIGGMVRKDCRTLVGTHGHASQGAA